MITLNVSDINLKYFLKGPVNNSEGLFVINVSPFLEKLRHQEG